MCVCGGGGGVMAAGEGETMWKICIRVILCSLYVCMHACVCEQ